MDYDRRNFLRLIGAGALAAVSGCATLTPEELIRQYVAGSENLVTQEVRRTKSGDIIGIHELRDAAKSLQEICETLRYVPSNSDVYSQGLQRALNLNDTINHALGRSKGNLYAVLRTNKDEKTINSVFQSPVTLEEISSFFNQTSLSRVLDARRTDDYESDDFASFNYRFELLSQLVENSLAEYSHVGRDETITFDSLPEGAIPLTEKTYNFNSSKSTIEPIYNLITLDNSKKLLTVDENGKTTEGEFNLSNHENLKSKYTPEKGFVFLVINEIYGVPTR